MKRKTVLIVQIGIDGRPKSFLACCREYCIFHDGANYTGALSPLKNPLLRMQMREHFGKRAKAMADAVFLPLGSAASEGGRMANRAGLPEEGTRSPWTSASERGEQ